MKKKNLVIIVSLVIIFIAGVVAMISMYQSPPTYDGTSADIYELYQNPSEYDVDEAEGISDIIVNETLDKTNALNAVSAVVFDFRGYDTMGEAFILITAISGSLVILRRAKKEEADGKEK